MRISKEFRVSMQWLHTWAGIIIGALLFVIFWTGTLTVFDKEIDQWMIPEKRVMLAENRPSLDHYKDRVLRSTNQEITHLRLFPPRARQTLIVVDYRDAQRQRKKHYFDPITGQEVSLTQSLGGSGFFLPFHYRLHIDWAGIGTWIVGFAAMTMMILLISGVLIHRKIVQDFFTFRPTRALRRSILDMHNLAGLVVLPFHFMIAFSGVIVFLGVYLPWSQTVAFKGDYDRFDYEVYGFFEPELSGKAMGSLAPIDPLVEDAETRWTERMGADETADYIEYLGYGDANALVSIVQLYPSRRVETSRFATTYNAETGELVDDFSMAPVATATNWVAGFHLIQFDHWILRWLYFFGGLSGCILIVTGSLFWMRARINRDGSEPINVRVFRALTVGTTTGLILATGVFFISNRVIPQNSLVWDMNRAELEVTVFIAAWISTFLHAAIRGRFAWREQCLAIAPVAVLAVLLNWITTGDHPIAAAAQGLTQIWSMDLVLLAGAGIALFAAAKTKVKAGEIGTARRETAVDMVE